VASDSSSLPPRIERYVPRDWVFPIVFALFVGVIVWFGRSIHDFLLPGPNTVTIPSFVGVPLGDANAEIARLQLKSTVIGHATSNQFPRGVVMNQQPQAGMHVRAGREVSLVVSDGVQRELMPDLRYQALREAQLDLNRSRLQIAKTTYVRNDDIPPDHIISQDPPPLSSVVEGTQVSLLVSRGGITEMKVPNFTGMTIDAARELAAQQHVKLGQIVWTPLGKSGPPHGEVVRQKPDPGETIGPYDVVSLQVSAGPNESGYIVHQTHVLTSVPQVEDVAPGTAVPVRLTAQDMTGTYDVYSGFAQPGEKLDFNVTTVGTSNVYFYVNNTLVGETHVGTEPPNAYSSKPSPKATGE
jgi:serine/threonine-protein kinase